MPVKLTTIPGPFLRPSPPKPLRWLIVLLGFIAAGILLMRFLGKLLGDTEFWWFAIGYPGGFLAGSHGLSSGDLSDATDPGQCLGFTA